MTTCRHSTQTSGMHFSDRNNIIFTTKWPFSKDMVQVLPHTSTKQRGVSLEATFGWRGWECEALWLCFFRCETIQQIFSQAGASQKGPFFQKIVTEVGFSWSSRQKHACRLFHVSWCKGDLLHTRWKCPTFESLRKQFNFLTGKLWVETCPRNRIERYRTSVWHSSPLRVHAWRTYNVKWMMCLYWTVSDVKDLVGPFLSTNRPLEFFFQPNGNESNLKKEWLEDNDAS